jgi:SAM-dependent methyltransferase
MPTSVHHNLSTVLTVVTQLNPKRVLDVGCGFGKYGVLLREYLDIWHERLDRSQWEAELVGIEGFERYRCPIHDYVYDKTYFGDACDIVPTLGEFDVVLILDVIEHLEKDRAAELLRQCLARSKAVIVSTPISFYPQHAICDNPYEMHRCHWTRADFPPDVSVKAIRVVACDIFVASRTPLPADVFTLADPRDVVYLHSRMKLGWAGLPLSLGLKWLSRLLS